ncbi:unnamed protein product [Closterium sp. NIES-65]|nr:unnamed protein product [Closterium sp. NIES-65]
MEGCAQRCAEGFAEGCVEGCMDGRAGRCVNGRAGRCVDGRAERCVDGRAGRCVDGRAGRCVDGRAERCVDGRAGRCAEGCGAGRLQVHAEEDLQRCVTGHVKQPPPRHHSSHTGSEWPTGVLVAVSAGNAFPADATMASSVPLQLSNPSTLVDGR